MPNPTPPDIVGAALSSPAVSFVVGLVIIYILSAGFGVLPTMGAFTPFWQDPLQNLGQMILPAITLGCAFASSVTRVTRSAMLEALSADYVRTARAKGVSPRRVVLRHALRNALMPIVTLVTLLFGELLAGAVLTEQVFTIPGFGKLVLANRKARMGRNPQTGEPIKIPAKRVLKFRIAKAMKEAVLKKDFLGMLRLGCNIYFNFH